MFQTASVYMLFLQYKSKLHPTQGFDSQFVTVTKINYIGGGCSQIWEMKSLDLSYFTVSVGTFNRESI